MKEENNKENNTQKSQRNNSLIISIIVIASIIIVVGMGIIVGIKSYDKYQTKSEKRENRNSQDEEEDDCENNLNVSSNKLDPDKFELVIDKKPVIYIYPKEEMEVSVQLGKSELLTSTYPKYNEQIGWKVLAKPDGTLVDEKNREYYSLYWEGKKASEVKFNDGFVVKGEDTIKFLEEKLEILGLTEKEAQEFIIYWLPQMENNEYNLIRFETIEEINNNMPLEVKPNPDTIIRIMMDWKALEEYIEIPEQKLNAVQRSGYTVVEWGGSEIK